MRQAQVLVNQIVAGILTETDDGRYIFQYDDTYLVNPQRRPIALAFPKRKEEYVADELFPFFFNMLSEGANKAIRTYTIGRDILAKTTSSSLGNASVCFPRRLHRL